MKKVNANTNILKADLQKATQDILSYKEIIKILLEEQSATQQQQQQANEHRGEEETFHQIPSGMEDTLKSVLTGPHEVYYKTPSKADVIVPGIETPTISKNGKNAMSVLIASGNGENLISDNNMVATKQIPTDVVMPLAQTLTQIQCKQSISKDKESIRRISKRHTKGTHLQRK
jgi:hypothetical protein